MKSICVTENRLMLYFRIGSNSVYKAELNVESRMCDFFNFKASK